MELIIVIDEHILEIKVELATVSERLKNLASIVEKYVEKNEKIHTELERKINLNTKFRTNTSLILKIGHLISGFIGGVIVLLLGKMNFSWISKIF